jgi:type IV fimbrial biogenesis protein FimT
LLDHQERRRVLKQFSPKANAAGFTLTELMIAVAILGILVMVALPNFQQMLRNWEVRAAAESVANGLQRARSEGVSRNTAVQFVLGAGTSWTVDYVTKPVPTDPPLDSRPSTEGSPNTSLTALASDATPATTATFNNLGQVIANPDASKTLAQVNFTAAGGTQTLRVVLGAGGSARVCDPSLPAGNVRAC